MANLRRVECLALNRARCDRVDGHGTLDRVTRMDADPSSLPLKPECVM